MSDTRSTIDRVERPRPVANARRLAAEAIGTFWLVLGGCGTAVFAAKAGLPGSVGMLGVAFAFGLTVFTMAFRSGSFRAGTSILRSASG